MAILVTQADGILNIAFNRPEKKNAITSEMYQALTDALLLAERDSAVRVVLISGRPEIFTAGNDLEDFVKNPPDSDDSPVFQFLLALSRFSKPIVAAVAGPAVGIGTTMLMHCDLVYAADNARLSMPFSQLGLCAEGASSLLFPQIAGYQRAAEKLLLGEPFGAVEAHAIGLVNKVCEASELEAFARAQAMRLAALPASSLRVTKGLMKAGQMAAVQSRIAEEAGHFKQMLAAPESREALSAFFQKRPPDFRQFN